MRIRKEQVIDVLKNAETRGMSLGELASRLQLPASYFKALDRMVDDLVFDGVVMTGQGGRLTLRATSVSSRNATNALAGVLTVHPRGFGFVSTPSIGEDIYVAPERMLGALHGDTVSVRVIRRSSRGPEGEVLAIVKRRTTRAAGILRRRGSSAWLEPDDTRIRGPIVLKASASQPITGNDGDAAVATITRFPEGSDENPEGELVKVLGEPGDPKVEMMKVLIRESIDEEHSTHAIAEAAAFGTEVDAAMLVGRRDLTAIPLPTIDPEDARDHDDAVWVVRNGDGSYRAHIAIADVSHYVTPGSKLDEEALHRGNSIYLPDRAIPMLPRALSSNLCSLLPDVVRLCMAVVVDLDATGQVQRFEVVEGFMRSQAKLNYPGVARALGFTETGVVSPETERFVPDLRVMADLAKLLRGRRMQRGALDFDLPEAKLTLDRETGAPLAVEKRTQDPGVSKAYQMIEELMLLANETIARFLVQHKVPTVFRFHGPPDQAKLDRFVTLCGELGIAFELEDAEDPKKLSAFLKKVSSHPKKQVLHMLLLRAMKQAVYDVDNIGHFGLASESYLHFTSPIRRYPDLLVHRAVRRVLQGKSVETDAGLLDALRLAATTASERERKAMEVEREAVDLYRALFMRAHLGEVFTGTVTALVGTGLFVQLDSPFVDVLVRFESLGRDGYRLDDDGLRVIGTRSGEQIAIGDSMTVYVEDVSIIRRQVYGRRMQGEEGDSPRKPALGTKKGADKRPGSGHRSGETARSGRLRDKSGKGDKGARSERGAASSKSKPNKETSKGSRKVKASKKTIKARKLGR